MRIVTSAQMKQIEQNSLAYDLTFHRLMENAGSAAAAFIRRTFSVEGRNCMVFCSKGNNGGDGLVVARKLSESGANIVVVMLDGIPRSEEASAMYQTVLMMELPMVDYRKDRQKISDFLKQADIVVDAICGTGFAGSLGEVHRDACRAINKAVAAVVSLDIPTGLECDTGAADPDAVRADFTIAFDSRKPAHVHPAAQAYCGTVEVVDIGIPEEAHEISEAPPDFSEEDSGDFTITLDGFEAASESTEPNPELSFAFGSFVGDTGISPEPSFVFTTVDDLEPEIVEQMPGPDEPEIVAQPVVEDPLEIVEEPQGNAVEPDEDETALFSPAVSVIDTGWVFQRLLPRPSDSHKGTYGRLLNLSGCRHYRGAAALSTLAALRSGVGLVTLASTGEVCAATAAHVLEATFLPLAHSATGGIDYEGAVPHLNSPLKEAQAVLIGCGLGDTAHTARLLAHVLENASCPVVVDADGINALAQNIHVLHKASAPVILTPHPGEMARLCGVSTSDIQRDRQGFATRFAVEHKVVLVLKGAETLVASPEGRLLLNETGNPGLAKGGSGDILAGMIGAFLAQGISPREAAACGVHLHGLAADRCAARCSQYAMLPSELLDDLAGLLLEHGR